MIEWPTDVNKVARQKFDAAADMVKVVYAILAEIDKESNCSVSLHTVTYVYGGGMRETIKKMVATVFSGICISDASLSVMQYFLHYAAMFVGSVCFVKAIGMVHAYEKSDD